MPLIRLRIIILPIIILIFNFAADWRELETIVNYDTGKTDYILDIDNLVSDVTTDGTVSGVTVRATNLRTENYTFPEGDGTNSQQLTTDGSGTVTWAAAGGHDAVTVTDTTTINLTLTGQDITADGLYTAGDDLTLTGADFDVDATVTRDTEWDTLAEINTASTDADILIFQNIAVATQTTVATDAVSDTLTLVGAGITAITTDATTDTITFTSTEVDGSTTNEINTITLPDANVTAGLGITFAQAGSIAITESVADTVLFTVTETDPNALLTAGTDNVKDTHIDWGVGASQVSADDIPDGATNAIITLTQETNFETAYTHSQDNTQAHSDYLLNSGADTMLGNLTITATDPAIILDESNATDTDFWIANISDSDGVDDDLFQIGDGTVVGTNPFVTILTDGNVGIGTTVPDQRLEVGDGTNSTLISSTGAITQSGSATLTLQDGSDLIVTANDNASPLLSATQSDTMVGTLTADGLTLGQDENITLGAQTLDHDGTDFVFNDSINTGANAIKSTANMPGVPHHILVTIADPNARATDDTEICIWPLTPAALTVTKIEVTLDASGNEVAGDLKYADTFIGLANAVVINDFDTTSGVRSDSTITSATVAASKCIYLSFDSVPNAAITQMSIDITFDYD